MAESQEDENDESAPDIDELDAIDAADQDVQDICDARAWVTTALEAVRVGLIGEECGPAVRSALDSLVITACARAKRSLRSDLGRGKV